MYMFDYHLSVHQSGMASNHAKSTYFKSPGPTNILILAWSCPRTDSTVQPASQPSVLSLLVLFCFFLWSTFLNFTYTTLSKPFPQFPSYLVHCHQFPDRVIKVQNSIQFQRPFAQENTLISTSRQHYFLCFHICLLCCTQYLATYVVVMLWRPLICTFFYESVSTVTTPQHFIRIPQYTSLSTQAFF